MSENVKEASRSLAAVFEAPNAPFKIVERPIPDPTPHQLLVKLAYSGVCHSDLHMWRADVPMPLLNGAHVGGHEGAGHVHKVGACAAGGWQVGDRVGVKFTNTRCNTCETCKRGYESICPFSLSTGFKMDGTFQQFALIDGSEAIRIGEKVDLAEAAPILCAGTTVYAALVRAELRPNDFVAITGAGGGLGLLAVQYARAMSYRVVAIDAAAKRDRVLELGADHYVAFDEVESVAVEVNRLTDGGAHGVLNLAASAKVVEGSLDYTRACGKVMLISLPPGSISIHLISTILRAITIRGTVIGNREHTEAALAFLERGLVRTPIESIIGLSELQQAFERMESGKIIGRIVVDLWKE